jgi:CubicO group peptidase (beta-lactamase class C family)
LVERGEAAWGARLPDLFPDLAREIDPGWSAITVDDLFFSRAGLPANLARVQMVAAFRDERRLREQRTEAVAAALARAPHRPGRFLYSNLGYIVIGAAIERLTDRPFESALAAHVLEPLGITSAGFGPPASVWGHGGRMLQLGPLGLVDLGRGAPADPGRPELDNPPVIAPAGRLHLTLADWARFQRVFLCEGGDFLRPETVARLLTPAPGRGYSQAMGWAPARGLGEASFGQQGSNTFWVATAIIDRARDRTALVVCNEGRARLIRQMPKLAMRSPLGKVATAMPSSTPTGGAGRRPDEWMRARTGSGRVEPPSVHLHGRRLAARDRPGWARDELWRDQVCRERRCFHTAAEGP